jgi:hypothetical protein
MLIYLAGAINGCTDEECKDWREYVKSQVGEQHTLDPMRRDYRGREMDCVDEIVEGDKWDIMSSSHILVHFDKPSVGTSMEVLYAWERRKPVIVVASKEIKLSPWLVYHSEKVFHSFKEALEYIQQNNLNGRDIN